jgi:hypothetical protein
MLSMIVLMAVEVPALASGEVWGRKKRGTEAPRGRQIVDNSLLKMG